MSVWLIEPRDPLIVRDGKPAGGDARLETLPFPFPSTTAGAARTRMASPRGEFTLQGDAAISQLLRIPVAGPILTEIDPTDGRPLGFFFPAPRDAMVFGDSRAGRVIVRRLAPRNLLGGAGMDSLDKHGLLPIAAQCGERTDKPFDDAPAYWSEKSVLDWLEKRDGADVSVSASDLGTAQLPTETRVHVSIESGQRVGIDGGLFQTKGLRFSQETRVGDERPKLQETRQFAISIQTPGGSVDGVPMVLRDELAPIGGERRLARWRESKKKLWPECPPSIINQVKRSKSARIVLMTPAMFSEGALPGWNGKTWPLGGPVEAMVQAACVGRPIVVSGWDVAKNEPKATRRLAPAGSVYFVRLKGDEDEIEKWVREAWLACVSDQERDRLDGFGLAMVGTWEVEG